LEFDLKKLINIILFWEIKAEGTQKPFRKERAKAALSKERNIILAYIS
jgi:hypothetical protein